MKQLIAFGMALVLLFVAGTPAYAQEDATRPETVPFVASAETDVDPIAGQLRRILVEFSDCNSVSPHRPWCRRTCTSERTMYKSELGDPNDNCALYRRKYTKTLNSQLPWPLCSCLYSKWKKGERNCVQYR